MSGPVATAKSEDVNLFQDGSFGGEAHLREAAFSPLMRHGSLVVSRQGSRASEAPRRFLFVSAPFGPFFGELAVALEAQGCEVWRLCFEGGDVWETPARNRVLVPSQEQDSGAYEQFVENVLRTRAIDTVVSFNDVLPRNRIALERAAHGGMRRFVLENGYLRPHWVTLERDGVNGFSGLPKSRAFYLRHRAVQASAGYQPPVRRVFPVRMRSHVINTIAHFAAAVVAAPVMRFKPDYYGDSIWTQVAGYTREYLWRQMNNERAQVLRIKQARVEQKRPVFTVLMQKPGDGQLVVHSRYGGNESFLREVIGSFAAHAPADALLIVKQHPLDYGTEKSPAFAQALFRRHGIEDRAVYLRMTSIDICMDHSNGLVTVNSTGGLAALDKGLAVKCMGEAVYDVEGLTFQGSLDAFWTEGRCAEADVLEGYVDYLVRSSQINGGFHSPEARGLLVAGMVGRLVGTSQQKDMFSESRASTGVAKGR